MPMTMIILSSMAVKMNVGLSVMVMTVHVPLFTVQPQRQHPAKHYQENPDSGLCDGFEFGRDGNAPEEND
jgi:hypothetical protein